MLKLSIPDVSIVNSEFQNRYFTAKNGRKKEQK